jgi:hypothetical protein
MGYLLLSRVSRVELNPYLNRIIMKNAFKFGFLALAFSLTIAACSSEKKADSTDSTMTTMDTMSTDSSAMDTMAKDTMMMDTTKK